MQSRKWSRYSTPTSSSVGAARTATASRRHGKFGASSGRTPICDVRCGRPQRPRPSGSVELDAVASELAEAKRRAEALDREARPYRITAKLIQELIDQMTGLLDHAPLETRVAWVRDLFERIDVNGVEQRAVARWKAPTDQDVDRLESVTEWLRR
jgi:hypothetical protein